MKKIQSYLSAFVCLTFAICLLVSCNSKVKKLKEEVETANKECPINIGGIISISSMTYLDDENVVEFKMTTNESVLKVSALKKIPNALKDNIMLSLMNSNESKKLLQELVDCDTKLRITLAGQQSGEKFSIDLTVDEIKSSLNDKMTKSQRAHKMVECSIDITKAQLPLNMGNGITLTDYRIQGTDVVYTYTINDAVFLSMKGNEEGMKENIRQSLTSMDPSLKGTMTPIADCGMGLVYKYASASTGESVEVSFTAAELKASLGI